MGTGDRAYIFRAQTPIRAGYFRLPVCPQCPLWLSPSRKFFPTLRSQKGETHHEEADFDFVLACAAWDWRRRTRPTPRSALTIYNQNFFVARERLPMDLKAGINHVDFAGIAAHLEPDSVILRDPNGRALQILEQSYRNDPISQELLLSFYEGKTIDFLATGTSGKIINGKIIRSGYVPSAAYANGYQQPGYGQPLIEIDGVLRFGLPGQPLFPALTGDSILKPTLSWVLETNDPGKFDAEISYVSGGMSWQADYNLVVSDKSTSKFDVLDMIGWVTMRNQSGKTFENANIKLLAGDVNKIQENTIGGRVYAAAKAADQEAMAPVVAREVVRRISSLHLAAPHHSARPGNQTGGIRARHQHSCAAHLRLRRRARPTSTATTIPSRFATSPTTARRRIPKSG